MEGENWVNGEGRIAEINYRVSLVEIKRNVNVFYKLLQAAEV